MLVHGLATTRAIWCHVVPRLRVRHRVVAIDLPGFGTAPAAGAGFDLDAVADVVAGALERTIGGPYSLVGHSLGGAVALALAQRRPADVRALVLVAPGGMRPVPTAVAGPIGAAGAGLIALRRAAAPLAASAWGRRLLLIGGSVDGARFAPTEVRAMVGASAGATRIRQALATVAAADLRHAAASLEVPLGIMRGEHDPVVRAGVVQTLQQQRSGLPVAILARCGHLPMMEDPVTFTNALETMLAELYRDRHN